jgi:predicted AlkP superfamily pyrophosphatase or phosphodiesterase
VKKLYVLVAIICLSCAKQTDYRTPKLVVVISVDQMRGDYLDKYSSDFSGGLKYLDENGQSFVNTHHNHANTSTAPGHATIASGFHPKNHGITNNTIYYRNSRQSHYSILDTSVRFVGTSQCNLKRSSAKNLLKPSIGDIVKSHDPKSKSYSISLKDRASILMGGHHANRAFWFDSESTQMVSTDYYSEPFPNWVKNYLGKEIIAEDIVNGWLLNPKYKTTYDISKDNVIQEGGFFSPLFPHTLSNISSNQDSNTLIGDFLWNTPFGDKFVLKFAKKLIENENLGKDQHNDVLTISLSAADYIGHEFGPDSYEIEDYYHKLDQYLMEFINFLNDEIGQENYVLTLTSDHGVAPFPELASDSKPHAKRISYSKFLYDIDSIDLLVQKDLNTKESCILASSGYRGIEPKFEVLNNCDADTTKLINSIQYHVKNLNYIEETISFKDINYPKCNKIFIDKTRNSHNPNHGYFIKIIGKKNCLIGYSNHGTTHGSPLYYDTHVPLIFLGNNIQSKHKSDTVYTIDIAPTLIDYIGITDYLLFDGKKLGLD